MWRKHPLTRITIGFGLALAAALTLGGALWFGADFWEDGRLPPQQVRGTVAVSDIAVQSANAIPGRFKLVSGGQTYEFELRNTLLKRLRSILAGRDPSEPVAVTYSPRLRNIYRVEVAGRALVQDEWEPGQNFQNWQRIPAYMLFGMMALGLGGFIYMLVALADLLLPPLLARGALVARIERAEARSEGFSIMVRPWTTRRPGRLLRFELSQEDFLKTDGADYVSVAASRLFRYVTQVRSLTEAEAPEAAQARTAGSEPDHLGLTYRPGWRLRAYLYADGLLALGLLAVAAVIGLGLLPEWLAPQRIEPPQWLVLPLIAGLSLVVAFYLLLRFKRKFQDVNARRRVTVGPVLSKWRVTGTSNDNRRLIVVADGGLAAGEQGVRKFDLSPALYDQLQVGDIVEIEHTPRLRFICRLEVKGHQELASL